LRFAVYDHSFEGDREWFRFTLKWTDSATDETRTRAGMQLYRIEDSKLAETMTLRQVVLRRIPYSADWKDRAADMFWVGGSRTMWCKIVRAVSHPSDAHLKLLHVG